MLFPHTGTPQPGGRKLELTRENLAALLSGHSTLKPKSQALSAFKNGSNQTSGGKGPGMNTHTVKSIIQAGPRGYL